MVPSRTVFVHAFDSRLDGRVTRRLIVQADKLLMWQFGWSQGTRDERYLDDMLYTMKPDELTQLQSHFRMLAEMPGNPDEHGHRTRMLEIIGESIPKAEAFLRDLSVDDVEPSMTDPDQPSEPNS